MRHFTVASLSFVYQSLSFLVAELTIFVRNSQTGHISVTSRSLARGPIKTFSQWLCFQGSYWNCDLNVPYFWSGWPDFDTYILSIGHNRILECLITKLFYFRWWTDIFFLLILHPKKCLENVNLFCKSSFLGKCQRVVLQENLFSIPCFVMFYILLHYWGHT